MFPGEAYLPYADLSADVRAADALVRAEVRATLRGRSWDPEAHLASMGIVPATKLSAGSPFVHGEEARALAQLGSARESRGYAVSRAPPEGSAEEAWARAVAGNRSVLENVENDAMNVELQAEVGAASWKVYAQTLEGMQVAAAAQLEKVREETKAVNQERKKAHLFARAEMERQKAKWMDYTRQIRALNGLVEKKARDAEREDGRAKRQRVE